MSVAQTRRSRAKRTHQEQPGQGSHSSTFPANRSFCRAFFRTSRDSKGLRLSSWVPSQRVRCFSENFFSLYFFVIDVCVIAGIFHTRMPFRINWISTNLSSPGLSCIAGEAKISFSRSEIEGHSRSDQGAGKPRGARWPRLKMVLFISSLRASRMATEIILVLSGAVALDDFPALLKGVVDLFEKTGGHEYCRHRGSGPRSY